MAVMIRLARQGAKHKKSFLVVAVDKAKKRNGGFLQKVGQYFPKAEKPEEKIKLNLEAIRAWQAKGARMTQTVGQLYKLAAK